MRKILSILFATVLLSSKLNAQTTYELTPFGGYTFADKFNIDQGTASISDGFTYGATVSMITDKVNALEFTYSRLEAHVSAFSEYHGIDMNSPVGLNYIFIGGTRKFPLNLKPLQFFSGVNIRVAPIGANDIAF